MRYISIAAILIPLNAIAASPDGLYFSHKDRELACDNTHTCSAADNQLATLVGREKMVGERQAVLLEGILQVQDSLESFEVESVGQVIPEPARLLLTELKHRLMELCSGQLFPDTLLREFS